MIILETDRLYLRNVKAEDAAEMYDYRNNPLCAKYQRGQTKDPDGIRALIEEHRSDALSAERPCLLAVESKDSGETVGEIVVMPNAETFSLGYTFSYKHHRKGYAFESLFALTDLLHARYPKWEFICFTDKANIASRALLEKLGYRDLGYLESKDSQVYGKWITGETEAEIAGIVKK